MKVSKKLLVGSMLVGAVAVGALCINQPTVSAMGSKPAADSSSASSKTYNGTFYVAGMGGHYAKAVATIDPSADQPIQLTAPVTKIDIGTRATHPTHDARIDNNDRNTMFWSTYKIDKDAGGTHVGKTDLKTGKVLQDVLVDVPPEATNTGAMYCASGQAKDHFIPITMSSKAYIDVFNKSDLQRVQRVFLEGTEAAIPAPYKFYHGNTNNAMTKLLIIANEADKDHGTTNGKMHLVELDLAKFVKGEIKVLNKGVIAGTPKSVTFRAYYSPDDSMIAASGGDVMFLVDAKTLTAIDTEPVSSIDHNHDAIFTPDGKYIVATSRWKQVGPECEDPTKPKEGEFTMDGVLKLYDVEKKMFVGKHTSVCLACHTPEGVEQHAILCGLDANFN
ncbi:MAG: hypothetical protein KKG47_07780 [Proteobacteria bacterium]|nr:hypothetical protein [Pseudomonadota bacterium]MBU1739367.1 hypothetical protein [Pseudomonadota bacterium]